MLHASTRYSDAYLHRELPHGTKGDCEFPYLAGGGSEAAQLPAGLTARMKDKRQKPLTVLNSLAPHSRVRCLEEKSVFGGPASSHARAET